MGKWESWGGRFAHRHAQERQKIKKRQTEYRTATTAYPCYLPVLGEFSGSWSYRFARAKVEVIPE
jgi:hypothetical protein